MEEPVYNSLSEQLRQSGLFSAAPEQQDTEGFNFFKLEQKEEENEAMVSQNEASEPNFHKTKKRINRYDLDLIQGQNAEKEDIPSFFRTLRRFLNFKEIKINKGTISKRDMLFIKLFPNLYKIRVAKEAVKRLSELDIDTETLLNKTIPYGENETRYAALVKYLNYANEIRLKLNKKF